MRKALFEFSESFEHDVHVYVEEWLEFPMRLTISECVSQLASAYDIPDVALEGISLLDRVVIYLVFHEKLSDFISNETTNDFKNPYLNLLNNLKCNMSNIENLCSIFDSSYSNETSTSKLSKMNDQEIFSRTFSQMIHSHAAQDFIHLEQSFALEIGNKFQKRNDILKEMDEKHINEIERSLQKRGSEIPETITQLQEDYYFNREIFESYWDSRISGLKWEQRQALRSFVMSYEGYANSLPINNDRVHFSRISSKDSSFKTQNSSSNRSSAISVQTISKRADRIPLSETFTAQLGRQLRTILPDDDSLAERMNNALNIYSDNLNGLVILVDKRINSFRGTKKLKSKPDYYEPIHGDVLITKHSNLISDTGDGIHVIFQVVVDYDNESNNIRIPHSLHCAISAILRICFDYDITTLSLPLLLVPSLSENMDKPWRAKRVEMVLKAVKGALMELITWRGFNLRSMEFLAPSCLTEEEFNVFRQIISNSFLQPNPLIAV
ncbi:Protein C12orf4 like [Schistosoma japonicum]|nr:Protein C12orf4 like [Schistosoma japonicum]